MSMNYDNINQIIKPLHLPSNEPIDVRFTPIDSLENITDIIFPYEGLLFYVKNQKRFFVVKSMKPGFRFYGSDSGEEYVSVLPPDAIGPFIDFEIKENVFIDKYEPLGISIDKDDLMDMIGEVLSE